MGKRNNPENLSKIACTQLSTHPSHPHLAYTDLDPPGSLLGLPFPCATSLADQNWEKDRADSPWARSTRGLDVAAPNRGFTSPSSVATLHPPSQCLSNRGRKLQLSLSTSLSSSAAEKGHAADRQRVVSIPIWFTFYYLLSMPSKSSFDSILFRPLQRRERDLVYGSSGARSKRRRSRHRRRSERCRPSQAEPSRQRLLLEVLLKTPQ